MTEDYTKVIFSKIISENRVRNDYKKWIQCWYVLNTCDTNDQKKAYWFQMKGILKLWLTCFAVCKKGSKSSGFWLWYLGLTKPLLGGLHPHPAPKTAFNSKNKPDCQLYPSQIRRQISLGTYL